MATDDERREVARRLRGYVGMPDGWWQETLPQFYIEKCVFGDLTRHGEDELFSRLADLIDPKGIESEAFNPVECDGFDREALLALADEMDRDGKIQRGRQKAGERWFIDGLDVREYARRIREACGEVEE